MQVMGINWDDNEINMKMYNVGAPGKRERAELVERLTPMPLRLDMVRRL